jgi:hypothetical protein
MPRDLDLALERLAQLHREQVRHAESRRALAMTAEQRLGLSHRAGDAIVDLVTGEEGVVLAGQRISTLLSPS